MSTIMITSVSWNPRGVAKALPIVAEASQKLEEEDVEPQPSTSQPTAAMDEDDIVAKYGLDTYDDEPDGEVLAADPSSMMQFKSNDEDPYIVVKDYENDELEDFMIKPRDDVLLSAVMEEDGWSHLDVCILPENEDAALFVHHDYVLSAFPLSVAWVPPNVAAVGTFHPEIELWDLNIVDSQQPDAKLVGHSDAVLGLAAHPLHHQMLASASADSSVRLWDISTQQTLLTMNHHKTKVQALAWSSANSKTEFQGLLASGGFDQRAYILDVRQHENVTEIPLEADVETLRWHTSADGNVPTLFVSTEAGDVICYDLVAGKRRWTLSAHVGAPCSSISVFQPSFDGPALLATSSPDSNSPLKLWSLSPNKGPSLVYQKTNGFGRLHSVAFSQERPFHLALGGHYKHPQVVNLLELAEIQRLYAGHDLSLPQAQTSLRPMTFDDRDGDSDEESVPKVAGNRKQSKASSSNAMDADADEEEQDQAPTRTKANVGYTAAKYLPKKKSLGSDRKKKR